MDGRKVAAALGLGVLLIGVVFGLTPMHRDGASCGSVFHGSASAADADLNAILSGTATGISTVQDDCGSARSDRAPIVWVLVGLGAVALAGAGIAAVAEDEKRTAARRQQLSSSPSQPAEPHPDQSAGSTRP